MRAPTQFCAKSLTASLLLISCVPAVIAAPTTSTPATPTPPPEDEPVSPSPVPASIPPADYTPQPSIAPMPNPPPMQVQPPRQSVGGVVALIDETAALTTLATSIRAAGLLDMLSGAGALTVFAPTDEAFAKLPADARAALMDSANKDVLARIISHHVVVGSVGGEDIAARIAKGGGTTTLTMLTGEPVTVARVGGAITLSDGAGNSVRVLLSKRSGSVIIHLVDGLIMPQPRKYRR
jgi:uncharacterized surface protein with fasciclin (FAS1) repeats